MRQFTLTIALLLFLGGCASVSPSGEQKPKAVLFFPAAPEDPKLQFLTSFSSSKDIEPGDNNLSQFVFGKEEAPKKSIIKPYGIKARHGKIYICDTVSASIEILDLKQRTFEYFRPEGRQQLLNPINLDITPEGIMYIADARRGQILVFDEKGKFINSIGNKGELKPTDVVVKDGKIYICDLKTSKVRVYKASSNEFLYSVPQEQVSKEGQLFSPTNMAVDDQGNIYVSDLGAFNVKKYDDSGRLLQVIGSIGDAPGNFARPKGISVDHQGRIYVIDAAFNNVQIFDPSGKLLLFFPEANDELQLVLPAGISIDYDHLEYFRPLIDKSFNAQYLVFVVSQYGERKINVFAFGQKSQP